MPSTIEFLQAEARSIDGVIVKVNRGFDTVCISSSGQDDIFMQGDDASAFIAQCDELFESTQVLPMDTIELAMAKPYVECIWS